MNKVTSFINLGFRTHILMKIPKTFIPEKDLNDKTEKLEVYLDFEPILASPEKIVFENLSFEQLKRLAGLEEKLYGLKITFGYKKGKYELIYSSHRDELHSTRGLLSVIQYPPQDNILLEEVIVGVGEIASTSPGYAVMYHVPPNDCSIVEFYPKKFSTGLKKIEQFFNKDEMYLLSHLDIENAGIRAEYRGLTEQEYKLYAKSSKS